MKKNSFYTEFDKKTRPKRRRGHSEERTEFERDRDRILHSYAFRRLQAKTQVFKTGEYDFYRTRLTHSIEVSQIGRAICALLRRKRKYLRNDFYIDSDLVEAVCLAHDLGHPPFGHAGEKTLNGLMDQLGGFEANAQTVRLLTETIWDAPAPKYRQGMCPTRAFLAGVLKYKMTRSRARTQNHFVYDEQEKYLNFVHEGLPEEFWKRKKGSIECQIMDWADEIAYSVGDFVDGVRARFITVEKLRDWRHEKRDPILVEKLLKILKDHEVSDFAADKIGDFIKACRLVPSNLPSTKLTNRYMYDLDVSKRRRREQECLFQISKDLVFDHPAVQQLEYKAQGMIEQLFGILRHNYLFPASPERCLLNKDMKGCLDEAKTVQQRARRLCDYVSEMSDDHITRMCRRLTEPEFGSIVDLV